MSLAIVKWTGTAAYLIGMALTAADGFHPVNLVFGAVGGLLWMAAGIAQRDRPLVLVEMAGAAIYLAGLAAWSVRRG